MKTTVQKETQQQPQPVTRNNVRPEEYVSPEVNIFETGDGYILEAEMPGVNKQGLEVTLEGNELTLVGRRHAEPVPGYPLFRESQPRDYRRVFELDPAIDTAQVSARV